MALLRAVSVSLPTFWVSAVLTLRILPLFALAAAGRDRFRAAFTICGPGLRRFSGHPAHTDPVPDVDLKVRLQPRAKRNAIVEEREGVLRVSVAAAPVGGQANAALCKLIAKRVGIARGRVSVIRGERSREKVVRVAGVPADELRRALGLARS